MILSPSNVRSGLILLILCIMLPGVVSAQMELSKMNEIRDGIIRLRQACLDSLHRSLENVFIIRQIIDTVNVGEEERKYLKYYFLGEGYHPIERRADRKNSFRIPTASHSSISDLAPGTAVYLHSLKAQYVWPKQILGSLAEYGQLEAEYPHKLTVSNYFYGLLSNFDFKAEDKIVVTGQYYSSSFYAMIMGLYLKNVSIHTAADSPYYLPNLLGNRISSLTAEGTSFQPYYMFHSDRLHGRIDKFLIVDLFTVEDKKAILKEAFANLSEDGQLLIIEKSKGLIKNDIKFDYLLPKGKIKRMARKAGFSLLKREDLREVRIFSFVKARA